MSQLGARTGIVREQSRSFATAGRRKSPEAVPRQTGRRDRDRTDHHFAGGSSRKNCTIQTIANSRARYWKSTPAVRRGKRNACQGNWDARHTQQRPSDYTGGQVGSEDAILSCEVFILEQEFLIDQPGDIRQQASPFVVWHEEHPSSTHSSRLSFLTPRPSRKTRGWQPKRGWHLPQTSDSATAVFLRCERR